MHGIPESTRSFAIAVLVALVLPVSGLAAGDHLVGPTPPGNLTALPGPGAGEIALSWEASSSVLGVTGYRIYRGTESQALAWLADAPPESLSITDTGLPAGTTFYYAVSGVDLTGESHLSNEAVATTYAAASAPEGLAAAPGTLVGELAATWAAPASDGGTPVAGYNVYLDGTLSASVDAATFSYAWTGLGPLRAYVVSVAAVTAVGEGAFASDCANAAPWVVADGLPECFTLA